jgi:hypothetical protein
VTILLFKGHAGPWMDQVVRGSASLKSCERLPLFQRFGGSFFQAIFGYYHQGGKIGSGKGLIAPGPTVYLFLL